MVLVKTVSIRLVKARPCLRLAVTTGAVVAIALAAVTGLAAEIALTTEAAAVFAAAVLVAEAVRLAVVCQRRSWAQARAR